MPARAPFHVMTKPIGPICQLDCRYCFYLEKEALYPGNERFRMSEETLRRYIHSYIEAQPGPEIHFAWQGGEPTLLGVDFFRRVVALQEESSDGRPIHNAFQTNGVLLDESWATFLAEHRFLVGVSIDGPEALHDAYRVDKQGRGTHARVMAGIQVLRKHRVEFNTLTCVHRGNAHKPLDVYRFLRGIGSTHLQFIPIVERKAGGAAQRLGLDLAVPPGSAEAAAEAESPVTPWSVKPGAYGAFLCAVFDRWAAHDVGRVFIQDFESALGQWLGLPAAVCIHNPTCGRALALEHDGSVYACDHFVYPEYKLGHIAEQSLAALADSDAARRFGEAKRDTLPLQCRECPVRFACHGGCPKHRFTKTRTGEPGLNYLCAAYYQFYTHIDPTLRAMAACLRAGRHPSEWRSALEDRHGVRPG